MDSPESPRAKGNRLQVVVRQEISDEENRFAGAFKATKIFSKIDGQTKERQRQYSRFGGGKQPFPVVGIGASAGGLEAFRELLAHLPTDTGMAFVLVPHLDPTHESILTDILARDTPMPVSDVQDRTKIKPNHIYVIPRTSHMTIRGGVLRLSPREGRGHHHSIDNFLRSLAEDQNNRAIGIILSGTASDGTLGLEAIKGEGGITFAQDLSSAKYDSMPRSAIASGCVDFILPPEGIAEELARISRHPYVISAGTPAPSITEAELVTKNGFKHILNILRKARGVDFAQYKINTLQRRTMRRMLLNKIDGYADYARYLETHPEEVENLYQDILINVTSFFRHPDAFDALKKKVFPKLAEHRAVDEPVRIWVLGCSTGEEAYSIAISFTEFNAERAHFIPVQIFATDVNDRGIERARTGFYSKSIAEDVSPERLRRFFLEDNGGYRVSKPIRDMCVFAQQNALSDPPFSHMDLISCRNLLIYLESSAQRRLMPLFHYALKPNGILWLGASETIGTYLHLFEPEDKKQRFYAKKTTGSRVGFDILLGGVAHREKTGRTVAVPKLDFDRVEMEALKEGDRIILSRFAPGSVLINKDMEILQFRGRTADYLEPPPGKASLNLLKMAREGLVVTLRSAIHKAQRELQVVRREGLKIKYDGTQHSINLEVIPFKISSSHDRYFLVLFEPDGESVGSTKTVETEPERPKRKAETPRVKELKRELASMREYVQSVVEQYEAANEELQSANEEVQSANEELQSINEELETAKEELESSNEELTTVNEELHNRASELGRANSDLSNLLASASVPMVMLDNDLRIRRFTTTAEKMLNLIPTDLARPISDINLNLNCPDLVNIISEVVNSVTVKEIEVTDSRGHWRSLQIRPYKTVDSKIDGAVLVVIDIDALKQHQAQLKESRDYAEAIVDTVPEPLLILDENLSIRAANARFYEFFNVTPEETEGYFIHDLGEGQWNIPSLRTQLKTLLTEDGALTNFEVEREFPGIGRKTMLLNARQIRQAPVPHPLIVLALSDITTERELTTERDQLLVRERAARMQAEDANHLKDEFLAICSHELRAPLSAIHGWAEMLVDGELDEATSRRGLETILRNVRAQTQIIEDLLDVSRVIAGKLRLNVRAINPAEIVGTTLELLRTSINEKQLKLTTALDREVGPFFADSVRLQQIVWNLLSNAVKFTPAGGSIAVRLQPEDDQVAIIVEDTGVGIKRELLSVVFDLFRQADSRTTRSYGGLGLGLAIVRLLVELHGGTVTAESAGEGKGATFKVLLPKRPPGVEISDEPEIRISQVAIGDSPAGAAHLIKGLRVLIVDDEGDSRLMLKTAFTADGCEVRSCGSASEALSTLKEWLPDVIVSDIGMPSEDGYGLIQRIRELPPAEGGNTPALALTGYATLDDHNKALEAGYQLHLAKPVDLDTLANALKRLAESSRQT